MIIMKSHGGIGKITPLQLLNEGKSWYSIWENTPLETVSLLPATYCLFTALELHMKAYLVFKNSNYTDIEKLKKLQHNFSHIFQEIASTGHSSLTTEINTQIKRYELQDMSLDKLKYPESGRIWLFHRGLEKKNHYLTSILKSIDNEITTNHNQWLINTYPKTIRLGVMLQIDYKGNPDDVDLLKLSNICSECLPKEMFLHAGYNYPWEKELIPMRTCAVCQNWFDPNGVRPSMFKD